MKRLAALLLMLAALTAPRAQRFHAFVAAGGAVSQVEGDELRGFKQLGLSAGVGTLVELDDNDRWFLSVEALYAQRGAWQSTYTDNLYMMNLYLNYVDIPVMAVWHDPFGGLYLGAGLTYGRLVQQPHSEVYYNPLEFVPDTNMRFLKNDLLATIDLRFPLWRRLMLDLRWQHSVIPIRKDWDFATYTGKDADGNPRYRHHTNNAYNHSISIRLIWQF